MSVSDPASFDAQVEALTRALESAADAESRRCARELVRLVLQFHGDGLRRMLEIIGSGSNALSQRLADDPLVASLFALHELSPAAAAVRPSPQPGTARTPLIQITRAVATPPSVSEHREDRSGCEQCGAPLGGQHHHSVDIVTRRLSCSCRACWLLAGAQGGADSRRPVPDRYLAGSNLRLTAAQWDALQVPVSTAFFMFNSVAGRTIVFYPSPAGATESALSLAAWHDVEVANPWVRAAVPDVEAILVRRSEHGDAGYDAFIVPIDACYDFVGRLRLHWKGIDGGGRVRAEIDRFFSEIAGRSDRTAERATVLP